MVAGALKKGAGWGLGVEVRVRRGGGRAALVAEGVGIKGEYRDRLEARIGLARASRGLMEEGKIP